MSAHLDICGKQFDVGLYLDCFSEIHNICVMGDLHRDLPFTFVFKINLKVEKEKKVPSSSNNLQVPSSVDCKLSKHLLVLVLMKMSLSQAFTFVLRVLYSEEVFWGMREWKRF